MKYIKLFEQFTDREFAPKKLESFDQQVITVESEVYNRYLETTSFLFFTNGEDGTLMYRKEDLSIVSDNYFAESYLWEIQGGYNEDDEQIIWASEDAKYNIQCQREEDAKNDSKTDI